MSQSTDDINRQEVDGNDPVKVNQIPIRNIPAEKDLKKDAEMVKTVKVLRIGPPTGEFNYIWFKKKAIQTKEDSLTAELSATEAAKRSIKTQELVKKAFKAAKVAQCEVNRAEDQSRVANAQRQECQRNLKDMIESLHFDQFEFPARNFFESRDGESEKARPVVKEESLSADLLEHFPADHEHFRVEMMSYIARKLVTTLVKQSEISETTDVLEGCLKDVKYFTERLVSYVTNKLVSIVDKQASAANIHQVLAQELKVESDKISAAATKREDWVKKLVDAASKQSAAADRMSLRAEKVVSISDQIRNHPGAKKDTTCVDVVSKLCCDSIIAPGNSEATVRNLSLATGNLSLATGNLTLESDETTEIGNSEEQSSKNLITNPEHENEHPKLCDLDLDLKRAIDEWMLTFKEFIDCEKNVAAGEEEVAIAEHIIFSSKEEMIVTKVKIVDVKLTLAEAKEEMARVRKRLAKFNEAMAVAKEKFAEAREAMGVVEEKKAEVRVKVAEIKLEMAKTKKTILSKKLEAEKPTKTVVFHPQVVVINEQIASVEDSLIRAKSESADAKEEIVASSKGTAGNEIEISNTKEIESAKVKNEIEEGEGEELAKAHVEIEAAQENLAAMTKNLAEVRGNYGDAGIEKAAAREEIEEAREDLADTIEEIAEAKEKMAELKEELAEVDEAREKMNLLKRDSAKASADFVKANMETTKAKEKIVEAKLEMVKAKADTAEARKKCMIKAGEDRPTKKTLKPLITKVNDLPGWPGSMALPGELSGGGGVGE